MSTTANSLTSNSTDHLGENTDSFYYLFPAITQCFVIILSGYFAGRFGLIDNYQSKGIGTYVTKFALPAVFFNVMVSLDFSTVNWRLVFAVTLSKCIIYILTIVIALLLHRPINIAVPAITAIFTTQSNDVALGFPILNVLFPKYAHYIYLFAPTQLILLNPISFVMMEWHLSKESSSSISDSTLSIEGKSRNTSPDSIQEENITPLPSSSSASSSSSDSKQLRVRMLGVVKNILLNPLIFMTIIGVAFNFILNRNVPLVIEMVLKVLANSFSATALFFLGTGMVGKMSHMDRRGVYMMVVLLLTKLLFAPFLTREMVNLFHPEDNSNDTISVTTFGFIYGSIPTAPPVFLFASQYHAIPQIIGSSLVIGTFLSAPLMFLSARLVTFRIMDESMYDKLLSITSLNISIVSLLAVIWVAIVLILSKRSTRLPHFFTMFFLLNNFLMCLGRIIDHFITSTEGLQTWPEYVQFVIFFIGVNGSRIYTSLLALALFLLKCRSLCFLFKHRYLIVLVGFCVPTMITGVLLVATEKHNINRVDPIFKLGITQIAVSLGILIINIPLTIALLILQGRQTTWHLATLQISVSNNDSDSSIQAPLIMEEPSQDDTTAQYFEDDNFRPTEDIDWIARHTCPMNSCTEEERRGCRRHLAAYLREQTANLPVKDELDKEKLIDRIRKEYQIDRHNILIIFLLLSMFFGAFLCVWRLVNESRSGVYIFLEFLDSVFSFGQGFMAFATFGLDPKLMIFPCIRRIRKLIYGKETVHIPPEECLDDVTKSTRAQFIRYHLQKCYKEIADDNKYRLVNYPGAFTGKKLINWLMRAGLAPDRLEALAYGKRLFDSRVLHHVTNMMSLADAEYLYQFNTDILNADAFNSDTVTRVCGAYIGNPNPRGLYDQRISSQPQRTSEHVVDIEDLVSSYDEPIRNGSQTRNRSTLPPDAVIHSEESCQHSTCRHT